MHVYPAGSERVKKIVVTGPECTGKSDLSQFLASHFSTLCVDEYAREYLNQLNRPYTRDDLIMIARGQHELETDLLNRANELLICDTDAIVIKVWSDYKYGNCDAEIIRQISEFKADLYLLTYIDIPWEDDPLREHPGKRQFFWNIFKDEIEKTQVPFVVIKGSREERRASAVIAIETLIQKKN